MRFFKADLHIHTCLSPCADLDMSPKAIAERSAKEKLDIIAICDHNSAENVGAAIRAGIQHGIRVLPGMEINSREEVHTLAIFETVEQAIAMQEIVYRHVKGTNRPDVFGDQVIANEFDEVEGFNDRLLIAATAIGLWDIAREIHRLGGLCIASHVDRPSYSILSQLGFVPRDLELGALEISRHLDKRSVPTKIPEAGNFPIVTFSDAHFLDDIGKTYTSFYLEEASVGEIRMALEGKSGRRVVD
jgi:PHP family Zn ribbon phosphoesterase